jgi:hypothetical protein
LRLFLPFLCLFLLEQDEFEELDSELELEVGEGERGFAEINKITKRSIRNQNQTMLNTRNK